MHVCVQAAAEQLLESLTAEAVQLDMEIEDVYDQCKKMDAVNVQLDQRNEDLMGAFSNIPNYEIHMHKLDALGVEQQSGSG